MLIVYFSLLGAIFGSFVNALVWRVHNQLVLDEGKPKKQSKKRPTSVVRGRSICESCGHELAVQDLIPVVSWLTLRGRCRYCSKKISWQNPMVEVATGAIFGLSYVYWPDGFDTFGWISFIAWLAIAVGLMALLVFDLRWLLLPNVLIYPLIVMVILLVGLEAILFDGDPQAIRDAVLGLAAIGGFFYGLFIVSKGRWIGGGDVKLAIFIGLLLSWAQGLVALYIGFFGASFVVLPLLITKRITRKQAVPFGPFLIIGVLVARIWGAEVIEWYSNTFLLGPY